MAIRTKAAPPNSVVLVSDADGGAIPKTMQGLVISATRSCVAVGCLSADEGETEFTLGALSELDGGEEPAYEGMLHTPSRKVAVRSVLETRLLEMAVNQDLTMLKIWINHPSEPDKIIVAVG